MTEVPPVTGNTIGSPISLALRHPAATFLAGLRFLTILPIPWHKEKDDRFFKASLLFFPIVGLLIGSLTYVGVSLFNQLFAGPIVVVFGLVLLVAFTGCLHLDGLADSFDGLLSYRSRERALEIMRDSHVGAMGVIALFFVLLGKYAALSSLSTNGMLQAFLLMPIAGRTAIVLSMAILPYAREGDGLGALFYSTDSRILAASATCLSIVCILLITSQSLFLFIFSILFPVSLFSLWCYKKLGGATGDTLGAVCELTELSIAVSFCVGTGV